MNRQMSVTGFKKRPKYLRSNHDIIVNEFNSYKKVYEQEVFDKIKYKEMDYEDEKIIDGKKVCNFLVETPDTPEDIKFEGKLLGHCVGSYIDRVMRQETKILFLRKNKGQPLVTLEVRGKVLIQAKRESNQEPTKEEKIFINTYAKNKKLLVRI